MPSLEHRRWAEAIAYRLSDEWDGKDASPEDAENLRRVLYYLFLKPEDACRQLIGTTVIEDDYFEPLE